jgi:hypothetical protein
MSEIDLGDDTHYIGTLEIDRWKNLLCWGTEGMRWRVEKQKALEVLAWLKENLEEDEEDCTD